MSSEQHAILLNEVRYAERLCQRTARMYRRAQSVGVFFTVIGGSSTLASLAKDLPSWVAVIGAALMVIFGAGLLAIRAADKAAANEVDAKRYAKLRTEARTMTADQLQDALNKARESDTPEVEPLRDVAWNDLMIEIGRAAERVPLKPHQQVLAALA